MKEIDPFYIGEITPDKEILFVNRKGELDDTLDMIFTGIRVAIPVVGDIGTGKTSFLNMVRYQLEKRNIRVLVVDAEDILRGKISKGGILVERDGTLRSESRYEVMIVDNIEKLNNKDAINVYQTLLEIANSVKIVFTASEEWLEEERVEEKKKIGKLIRLLSTERGSFIYMDLTPERMAYFLEERFRNLGKENRFNRDALLLAGERANKNLRVFFQYCRAAHRLKKEGKITVEVMKDAILAEDLGLIKSMGEISKGILRILMREGEMTNQDLMKSLKELVGDFGEHTYYDMRRELEREGFIRVERRGKKAIISDIYHLLNIDIKEEMLDEPLVYRMKIRDSYMQPSPG